MKFFTLKIQLGNDAMVSLEDVGHALQRWVNEFGNSSRKATLDDHGTLRDINGNTVGWWEVSE